MLTIEFADYEEIEDTLDKLECPCCHKTSRLKSRGGRWKCSNCGKQFSKIRRRNPINIGDRPSCPECGNQIPNSHGRSEAGEQEYVCTKCGRYYTERTSNNVKLSAEVEIE